MTKFKKNTHLSLALSLSLYLSIYRKYAKCRTKAGAHDKIVYLNKCRHSPVPCTDPEGGQGVWTPPPPLKNHKNIEFLSNTGPDPLQISKTTKPAFNVGSSSARQRNAILRRFAGGLMMARFL